MNSDVIISVENLGKRYSIRHERERYTALRDVIANKAKSLFRRNGRSSFPTPNSDLTNNGQPITDSRTFRASTEEFWALRNVTFEVKRGEVLGIIGRNGAGKTTLLKILSRITEPTEGRVRIKGRVASLLEVGTGFHPELTGRENIYLNGAILGMTKAEIKEKFDEIVNFAETEKFLDTPVKRYSSGMYVRLAFAVAAHLEPEILIVDEVLAVGDIEFQKKCLGKMQSVAKQGGRTVLFVSHNMGAILQLCRAALLLNGGSLIDYAPAADVVAKYLRCSVAGTTYIPKASTISADVHLIRAMISEPSTGKLHFGDAIVLKFEIVAIRRAKVAIEIILRDQRDHPVIFLPSGLRFGKEFVVSDRRSVHIACRIGVLPLAEGRYSIDVLLASSGFGILERHERALEFEVVCSDPGKTNRSFTQETGQGCIHLDAEFSQRA